MWGYLVASMGDDGVPAHATISSISALRPCRSGRSGGAQRFGTQATIEALLAAERRHGVSVQAVGLSASQLAQSNASETQFGASPSQTIHAGLPVAEQLTTTYAIGSPQTETLLKVPNAANNSVTTYKTINLRNDGGVEKVVDVETFSGGSVPFSGTDNTHSITTTLPDGTIQTTTENVVIQGHKTVVNATVHEADGNTETWTSVSIRHGQTTTANKTIRKPDGTVEHQKIVTSHVGALDFTARTTTTQRDSVLFSPTAINVLRVQPPSS